MSFENYVIPNEGGVTYPKLNVHLFRAVLQERIEGQKTSAECLIVLETQLGQSLTTSDINDLQNIMGQINGQSTVPDKMAIADRVYRVFILAEAGCEWFDSRQKIKSRLGFS